MVRRSGLGRGLEALIPSDSVALSQASPLRWIDIAEIVPNRYQPRGHFDEEALRALADSIALIGVIQPIIVREVEDCFELIAGERRWRAAQRAGLETIPAMVRSTDDKDSLEAAVVENVHREDLNVIEEAAAYRQLMDDFGLTQEDVATRVGRSRSAVANTVRLLNLSPSVQRLLIEGQLSAGHGRALLALESEAAQHDLALLIVNEGLTVREAEQQAASHIQSKPVADAPKSGSPTDRETQAGVLELEDLLSGRLEAPVSVKLRRGRGKITVEFSDLSDLERIYNLIMTMHSNTL